MKKIKRIIAVAALIFAVVAGGYLIHTAKQTSKTEGGICETNGNFIRLLMRA